MDKENVLNEIMKVSHVSYHVLNSNFNLLMSDNLKEDKLSNYFKVRNFRGKKLSRFRGFLAFSRKFFPAKFFKMSQPRKFFPAKFFKMSQPRKFFPAKVFQKGSTAKVFSREIKKINNTTDCKLDDIYKVSIKKT